MGITKEDLASAIRLAEITHRFHRNFLMDEIAFDMPSDAGATFEDRGGWVVLALAEDFDLSLERAAGVVGNLGYESGGFKKLQEIAPAIEGSRGGYGWAQWTGPRRRAYEAFCSKENMNPASDEANYNYLVWELSNTHSYCLDALNKETTLDRAVFTFGRLFEAPGGTTDTHLPGFNDRLHWAQRALAGAKERAGSASRLPQFPPPQPSPSRPWTVSGFLDRIFHRG